MIDQEDIDSINDKLYSLEVPHEPLKKIMFYFTVLSKVLDIHLPKNYLNYDHPYFKSYNKMEEFLSLARALNPEFLYQNNVIIFHNKKDIYKYYQEGDDKNGIPYEFKVIDPKESLNPLFSQNYENPFNISNVNPKQTKFFLSFTNKVNFPHSEDSEEDAIEDFYCEEEYENQFEPDEYRKKSFMGLDEIRDYFDESEIQKNVQNFAYENQMNSTDELEEDEYELEPSNITNLYETTVKIKKKLVVTSDWINFIYTEPSKILLLSMKTVIKEDDIVRSKSITLPKNIFFYLEILMLALLICCSVTLFLYAISLQIDSRFHCYEGKNDTFIFFPISAKNLLQDEKENIDYSNDSFIVPDKKKYKVVSVTNHFSIVSSVLGTVYFIFIIYMWIRVCREDKKEYQTRNMKSEAGLNMCHIVVLIILTVIGVLISIVDGILTIVSLAMKTYDFIHYYMRTQLILNSILFVCYILIQYFYCMI